MAAKRYALEITLENIHVLETGKDTDSRHLLTATLLWPRLAIAHKTTVQPCLLKDGAITFTAEEWCDAILFKETVEGRFGIVVSLSEAMSDERLDEFLRFFGRGAFTIASKLVDDWAGPVGLLAALPFDFVAKQLGKAVQTPAVIAEGSIHIDTTLWDGSVAGPQAVGIPLTAPHPIEELSRQRIVGRDGMRTVRKERLAKGEGNGEVRLVYRVL